MRVRQLAQVTYLSEPQFSPLQNRASNIPILRQGLLPLAPSTFGARSYLVVGIVEY